MENEVSSEFLACLRQYRRKAVVHKAFQAWRKHVLSNRRRYSKACVALEHWNHMTIRKIFNYFKRQRSLAFATIPYSKGVFFVLLVAMCFLPPKTFKSHGCRMDKLLSLFKQNNILKPNLGVLKNFVQSWESHLVKKYFQLLQKRWLMIKDFKNWRSKRTKARCVNYLRRLVQERRGFAQLFRVFKLHFFLELKQTTQRKTMSGINEKLATKFRAKTLLQKSFQVMVDFTNWNRQNTDKLVFAKKYFSLNLMMKSISGLKQFVNKGAAHKQHKVLFRNFRNKKLMGKAFSKWKRIHFKKEMLQEKLDKYVMRKDFESKRVHMGNWRWIYATKTKLAYYKKLKLLEKGFKGLKDMVSKKEKVMSIARLSVGSSGTTQRNSHRVRFDPNDYLMDERNEVLDKIIDMQLKNQTDLVKKYFGQWGRRSLSNMPHRRFKSQAQLYHKISFSKSFFNAWKDVVADKGDKFRKKEISKRHQRHRILNKVFVTLKSLYLESLLERKNEFRSNQFYEEHLLKKAFETLLTEKEVSNMLCTKLYERYCNKIVLNSLEALTEYYLKKKQVKQIIRGFQFEKGETLIQKAFYYLKERADFNIIKRRSNKLARIVNKKTLYTKVFKAFRKAKKVQEKKKFLVQKQEKKIMRNSYLIWRKGFKEENKSKKVVKTHTKHRLAKIFGEWKKYSQRKVIADAIVKQSEERRNQIYLRFTLAIWKKFIILSRQKASVGQALFISYVYRFKKQVLRGWRDVSKTLQEQRETHDKIAKKVNEGVMSRYFEHWFEKNARYRSQMQNAIEYISEKQMERTRKIFKAWATVAKGKAVVDRILKLWTEKVEFNLLGKAFQAWSLDVSRKNTTSQLIDVRAKFLELRRLKTTFGALKNWMEKRQWERSVAKEIQRSQRLRCLENHFSIWCEEYKDIAFEKAGSELVDKYRKILCFRYFQKKVVERIESRNYGQRLDQFAMEVYKRKAFIQFGQNAQRLLNQRKVIQEREELWGVLQKKKAFSEFRQLLQPRVEHYRANCKAMKCYVMKLYRLAFQQWKLLVEQQGDLIEASSEKLYSSEMTEEKIDEFLKHRVMSSSATKINREREERARREAEAHNKVQKKRKLKEISQELLKINRRFQLKQGFDVWRTCFVQNNQRKNMLIGLLAKQKKTAMRKAFRGLADFCEKQRKLDFCFEELHERYIVRLKKRHYDTWKMQFVFQRLNNNSGDGDSW